MQSSFTKALGNQSTSLRFIDASWNSFWRPTAMLMPLVTFIRVRQAVRISIKNWKVLLPYSITFLLSFPCSFLLSLLLITQTLHATRTYFHLTAIKSVWQSKDLMHPGTLKGTDWESRGPAVKPHTATNELWSEPVQTHFSVATWYSLCRRCDIFSMIPVLTVWSHCGFKLSICISSNSKSKTCRSPYYEMIYKAKIWQKRILSNCNSSLMLN